MRRSSALARALTITALPLLLAVACGGETSNATADKKADVKADKKADAKADKKAAPFATPNAKPPPPPEGLALLEKPDWLYVQKCDKKHPCPKLFQAQGEKHCRELKLGQRDSWRLPDRKEVEGLTAIKDQLEDVEGFHWTRTPYDEDPKQVWIVDPIGGYKTTAPRTRKPFTIRCVQEP